VQLQIFRNTILKYSIFNISREGKEMLACLSPLIKSYTVYQLYTKGSYVAELPLVFIPLSEVITKGWRLGWWGAMKWRIFPSVQIEHCQIVPFEAYLKSRYHK